MRKVRTRNPSIFRAMSKSLSDLHKPQTDCTGIVESIAKAITIEALQVLFVSTQRANARLCTRYAIGWYVTAKHKRPKK